MEKSSFPENKRVARIRIIMDREHLKQKDLADALNMEPQNFSRIMISGKVSEKTCRKIIELYPEYRLDWLMGYDDIMTVSEFRQRYAEHFHDVSNATMILLDDAVREVCAREGLPIPQNLNSADKIPEFLILQAQLRDYADSLIWNYLKHREHSHLWTLLDQN